MNTSIVDRSNALTMVREEYDALMNALAQLAELADFAAEDSISAEAHDIMAKIAVAIVEHEKARRASKGNAE